MDHFDQLVVHFPLSVAPTASSSRLNGNADASDLGSYEPLKVQRYLSSLQEHIAALITTSSGKYEALDDEFAPHAPSEDEDRSYDYAVVCRQNDDEHQDYDPDLPEFDRVRGTERGRSNDDDRKMAGTKKKRKPRNGS